MLSDVVITISTSLKVRGARRDHDQVHSPLEQEPRQRAKRRPRKGPLNRLAAWPGCAGDDGCRIGELLANHVGIDAK
jgi:hypothetical protein